VLFVTLYTPTRNTHTHAVIGSGPIFMELFTLTCNHPVPKRGGKTFARRKKKCTHKKVDTGKKKRLGREKMKRELLNEEIGKNKKDSKNKTKQMNFEKKKHMKIHKVCARIE